MDVVRLVCKAWAAAADTRHFRKNSAAGLEAGTCHRTTFEVGTTPGTAHSDKTLIMSQLQSQNVNSNNSDNSGKAKGVLGNQPLNRHGVGMVYN